jgi:hypothetical protein
LLSQPQAGVFSPAQVKVLLLYVKNASQGKLLAQF